MGSVVLAPSRKILPRHVSEPHSSPPLPHGQSGRPVPLRRSAALQGARGPRVYVGHLAAAAEADHVRRLMAVYGGVARITLLPPNPADPIHRGAPHNGGPLPVGSVGGGRVSSCTPIFRRLVSIPTKFGTFSRWAWAIFFLAEGVVVR